MMKFAVIAAGEGARLVEEGVALPKPLVLLNGEPMLDRLLRIFFDNDAEEVAIIVNERHPQTAAHVRSLMAEHPHRRLHLIVKNTPSSMHSFAELSPYLENAPFCLTTVDTVFREKDFRDYISAFKASLAEGCDGMMGVTDFIDDEKPLYIHTDEEMNIRGFYDRPHSCCRFISGGVYALTPRALRTLSRCMAEGQSRMRNFQRGLVADGLKLKAHLFSKILDVDHVTDIEKAEHFLRG